MATEEDKVNSGVLGTLLAVLTFGVLATALAITALVRTGAEELRAERSGTDEEYATLRGSQEADLHLPAAYIDEQAGVVRLPIDRAMEVVVRDLRRNPESATAKKQVAEPTNGHGEPERAAAAEGEAATGKGAGDRAEDEEKEKDRDTSVKPPPRPKAPPPPPAPKQPGPATAPAVPKTPAPKPAPAAPKPTPEQAPGSTPAPSQPAPAAPNQ